MKRISFLFFVILITVFGCSKEDDNIISDKDVSRSQFQAFSLKSGVDWHSLTQTQKDAQIINRANLDNGNYVGLSCKEWVRAVVLSASNNHITIPATNPNNYSWANDPTGHVLGRSTMIQNVNTADLIQMKFINGGPHTAIVLSKNSTGMTWIHSNWHLDQKVSVEFITYSYFNSTFGTNYSVFHVQ